MKNYNYLLCCLLFLLASCKTASIFQESDKSTNHQVTLGTIGSEKGFMLQNDFNNAAIPTYQDPIRLVVKPIPFSKSTFKAFTKAKALQRADVVVHYIDSLAVKPQYIELQIADKVAVINTLNLKGNSGVKEYLSHNSYANVLTSVSLALNQEDLESIKEAEAIFLVENPPKIYVLELHKKGSKTQTISFSDSVVFGYKVSQCCWQENKKHQLDIVDLVSEYTNCPNRTHRSAKQAEKKINYYRF